MSDARLIAMSPLLARFSSRRPQGFTLIEVLVTVAVLGILASVGSASLIRSVQIWGLRSTAVELAGYLENAQAVAAGHKDDPDASTVRCILAITGTGDALQIGPTAAANNVCANLPATQLLPNSLIPLAMKAPSVTTFTFGPGGTLPATITSVLSSANAGNTQYCVQLQAPSALVGIGRMQGGTCNYAAFN